MSKVAQYLNEHLLGSVTGLATRRAEYASDASVLEITSELVVYPKTTNDIRKTARFSWQLAEKGHTLSLIPRGLGGDTTGGAIGTGLLIDTSRYLTSVLHVSSPRDKARIVHVQPGVRLQTLHEVLRWQGATIGAYTPDMPDMTVGGAIAGGVSTYRSGKYGTIASNIERMEVVLANGDLMEVGRISKRDLNKKQGEQTFEGDIYRRLDGLFEEHAELIDSISSDHDAIGYDIDKVRRKDGSFDLTPLFVGSQGTLGILSEVVLRTDFYSDAESAVAIVCDSPDDARDVVDIIRQFDPTALLMIDAGYFTAARSRGKTFVFDTEKDPAPAETVVYSSFDDFSDKVRRRKLKRITKALAKREVRIFTTDDYRADELDAIRDVEQSIDTPLRIDETYAAICDGAYVPSAHLREFAAEITSLAETHHVALPLKIDMLTGVVSTTVTLHLKKVSDKQKLFKLATDYAEIVFKHNGSIAGGHAEGRIGAFAAYPRLDEAVVDLNAKIRAIFDPFNTLNPSVKQANDHKTLARQLKGE